jgi:hypothetical protein
LVIGATAILGAGVLTLLSPQLWGGNAETMPQVDDVVHWSGGQVATGLIVAGVLLALICVWVLLAAMPRKPPVRTLRFSTDQGSSTMIKSDVIAKAAQEAAEHSGLITTARVRISGSAASPSLYAAFSVRSDRPLIEAVHLVNERVVTDMETVLGAQFTEKHIRYDVNDEHTKSAGALELTSLPATAG